jgi:hypothetical protein
MDSAICPALSIPMGVAALAICSMSARGQERSSTTRQLYGV